LLSGLYFLTQLNSRSIHFAFISPMGSWDAVGGKCRKPLSQASNEKEVSHGHEEAEEEEDVEVNLASASLVLGYASASFRDAQRSALKTGRCRLFSWSFPTPATPPTASGSRGPGGDRKPR
jgi:hypothetical protein